MKKVGIIGGGQLGMMLAESLKKKGAYVLALDPNPNCSCSHVCDEIIVGDYGDLDKLKELGDKSDVLTYEFENVPADKLIYLKNTYNIPQGIEPLFDSQNRIREKNNARAHGLKTPDYYEINSLKDLEEGLNKLSYPALYKTTTLGYDGHGQVLIKNKDDIEKVKPYLEGQGILEQFIKFDYETSCIVIRSKDKCISFPMGINHHKKGILDLCVVDHEKELFKKIRAASEKFMIDCNYYGILTIEYFVKGDEFYFNEMAPRPHNSGHYTIEGCNVSQYSELASFLLEEDIKEPKLLSPTIMKNILGFDYENMKKLKDGENIHIHDYFKTEVRERRKMAHITFTNTTSDEYDLKYKNLFAREE